MRLFKIILLWLFLAAASLPASAAESAAQGEQPAQDEKAHHEEGLTARAVEIWAPEVPLLGRFPITNSMIVTWAVALVLIVFAQIATRRMTAVPSGAQNFIEWLVESLYTFLEGVIGHDLVRKTFWFFATIFIFILFSNWLGLIPGFGTIGFGERGPHGFHVSEPWFRGVNADLN